MAGPDEQGRRGATKRGSSFSAIGEAVFGYLLQQSGLAERARAVLGLDRERCAFQTALARAYTAFARRYPVASRFPPPTQ